MAESLIDQIIRRQTWLEKVGDVLQSAVGGFYGALGRPGHALKNLMHGTTLLGHPLHPAVTDIPIGAWAVGVVADYVAHFTNRIPTESGDVALAVGLSVAVLAAATGLTDYHETVGHERRVGTAHGLTMVMVVVIDAVSLVLRWAAGPSLHPLAVGLSTAGFGLVLAGAYLGGHLVFGIGTMVNHNAFAEAPEDYIGIGKSSDFAERQMRRVMAGPMQVLAIRRNGVLHVIGNVCSHAGGPLHEGTLAGDRVTCPWHASQFRIADGRVKGGPATFGQPLFAVRERDGSVEVKATVPPQ
jgi:nitrite reductase/ring-hydroxylating ferredoxin subunit/uncharacterized membrane protein